jgi:SNF2 family DNA or RNA helicase
LSTPAESIRNRQTKISRAVTRIDSLYRWALTGTPITNSLADLHPLFRFLQLKPWYDWTRYRAHGQSLAELLPSEGSRR